MFESEVHRTCQNEGGRLKWCENIFEPPETTKKRAQTQIQVKF